MRRAPECKEPSRWSPRRAGAASDEDYVFAPGPDDRTLVVEAPREVLLEDVDLLINRGDRIGLIGVNGSGKTTLGRLLVGLLEADAGHVVFEDQDLAAINGSERRALRRRIQFIAQCKGKNEKELLDNVRYSIDHGACAAYIQGMAADM